MPFKFDKDLRRYIREDGTIVNPRTLRRWIDDAAVALGVLFITRAQAAQSGKTEDLRAWSGELRATVPDLHRAATIIGAGGLSQMDEEFWQHTDDLISFHTDKAEEFIASVVTGATVLDGIFVARSALYGAAFYTSYENTVKVREVKAGMNLYRRRLDPASRSCEECRVWQSAGWRLIGQLPNIGEQCACRARCRCFWQFRTGTIADVDDSIITPLI